MTVAPCPRLPWLPGLCALAMAAAAPACGGGGGGGGPPSRPGEAADVWVSDPGYHVTVFAANLAHPRQMAIAPNGDLFISNNGDVTVVFDDDHSGASSDGERATFASAPGLNHGLALSPDGGYVYASSSIAVFRWRYTAGARQAAGAAEVVVSGIPGGGHVTRTLVFDSRGRLYVSIGSALNVDVDPVMIATRGQIRRFALTDPVPAGGVDWATGEVVASGMRNEVGLFMDARDRIWSVENGRDTLTDGGTDIHNGNPGEEVNLVDGTGATYYGYSACYTEFSRPGGLGPGTQWADTTLDAPRTDAWCRDPANVHPPVFAMPAHWAPLGILEYQGSQLPIGHDLLVTAHGSWNSDNPVGRVIARLHRTGDAIASSEVIVGERGPDGALRQGQWGARPVDLREAADGAVYVSDDGGGRVFKITYSK